MCYNLLKITIFLRFETCAFRSTLVHVFTTVHGILAIAGNDRAGIYLFCYAKQQTFSQMILRLGIAQVRHEMHTRVTWGYHKLELFSEKCRLWTRNFANSLYQLPLRQQ